MKPLEYDPGMPHPMNHGCALGLLERSHLVVFGMYVASTIGLGCKGLTTAANIDGFVSAVSDLLEDEAQQERLTAGALATGET
jgi:hypothetical protein